MKKELVREPGFISRKIQWHDVILTLTFKIPRHHNRHRDGVTRNLKLSRTGQRHAVCLGWLGQVTQVTARAVAVAAVDHPRGAGVMASLTVSKTCRRSGSTAL